MFIAEVLGDSINSFESTRGSFPGRKPTSEIIRLEASRSSDPKDWLNACGLTPSLFKYCPLDFLASGSPAPDAVLCANHVSKLNGAIQRHPAHQLRIKKVTRLTAHLPNSLVLFLPAHGSGVGQMDQKLLGSVIDGFQLFPQQVNGAQEFAVNVNLSLVPGTIANSNRAARSPPRQVGKLASRRRLLDFVESGNRLLFADGKSVLPLETYFPRYDREPLEKPFRVRPAFGGWTELPQGGP